MSEMTLSRLDNYIISITDETIKSIAIQRFIFKKKYQQIADYMNLSKGSVYRMLSQYIKKATNKNTPYHCTGKEY